MKRLIFDVDGTIATAANEYAACEPNHSLVEKLRDWKSRGYEIVLYTSRNMRTHDNNIGRVNAHMLPILMEWLDRHRIPYDEVWTGKPWCGTEGFYVDDRAIRPREFVELSEAEIREVITRDGVSNA